MNISTQQSFDPNDEKAPALGTVRVDDAFWRTDWLAAALVVAVTFGLYLYTLMPNVGLQDSGELVTAAALFGVPHPPGYPLWSLSGFLLKTLLPVGNYAWRINLESAIFGSLACGILTLLVASSSRWLLHRSLPEDRNRRAMISFYGAAAAGMILGFSDAVWGQGVFAEVYTLNAFLLLLTLLCLYRWIVAPEKRRWLVAAVFAYNLGLTNHPTMLMIAPAFLLPVFLVRRSFFPSFLLGFSFLTVTAMGVLTWYSGDSGMESIAWRLAAGEAILGAALGFWHTREFNVRRFMHGVLGMALIGLFASVWIGGWFHIQTAAGIGLLLGASLAAGLVTMSILDAPFIVAMTLAGWCALLVFAKSPVSSRTNPPMNWSYAQDQRGFYQSIIRGQYANNLAVKIKAFVGPLVGYHDPDSGEVAGGDPINQSISFFGTVLTSIKLYGRSLEDNFTLPVCLLSFPLVIYFGHLDQRQRPWIYFMVLSFLLLAFTLTFVDTPEQFDRSSWLAIKPFHILSHCMFVLAVGYGIVSGLLYLSERMEGQLPSWTLAGALFTSVLTLQANVIDCNQRGHWFGWQYGVDMLKPLDKNAVVFGGTDPGRFVTTYMIFCESQQPVRFKRDPDFDRSDLYVITQNALADISYLKYIRDHYDDRFKPKKYTRFEKWLGREQQFPKQGLHLLNDSDYAQCLIEYTKTRQGGASLADMSVGDIFAVNGVVARKIFEDNKKTHTFYVEESLPIPWMYPYMVPAGLIMRLNPEPLDKLPQEAIDQDRKFWDAYTARLLADPYLRDDVDAEKSFSKLRHSFGNMYRARGLYEEALYAYRQALQISPDNGETVGGYFDLLMTLGRFDEAERAVKKALELDPLNTIYVKMVAQVREQREVELALNDVRKQLAASPNNFDLHVEEVNLLGRKHDIDGYVKSMEKLVQFRELTHEQFVQYVKTLAQASRLDTVIRLLQLRLKLDPKNEDLTYNLAAFHAMKGEAAQSLRYLSDTIAIGGPTYVTLMQKDARFHSLLTNSAYQKWARTVTEKTPAKER
jgi:tetratricopeptide (TPR) repeat protein